MLSMRSFWIGIVDNTPEAFLGCGLLRAGYVTARPRIERRAYSVRTYTSTEEACPALNIRIVVQSKAIRNDVASSRRKVINTPSTVCIPYCIILARYISTVHLDIEYP